MWQASGTWRYVAYFSLARAQRYPTLTTMTVSPGVLTRVASFSTCEVRRVCCIIYDRLQMRLSSSRFPAAGISLA